MMDVSIILVNYKTSKYVHDVISSIKEKSQGFSYEIIVVDNSNDINEFNKLLDLKEQEVILVDAKSNLGFGKANNLGAQFASGKYLYCLNTDTLLMNNAIFELKDFLDKHDNVAVVGSNLYTKDGKPNHSFYPMEKNLKNEKKMTGIKSTLIKFITRKRMDFNYTDIPGKIEGYVCGASLMMRKDSFIQLGGFDKDIFMYAEESLLCYRVIHELKKEIYNIPASKIIHFEGGSFEKDISYNHAKLMVDGNCVYYYKLFGKEEMVKFLKWNIHNFKKKKVISIFIKRNKHSSFVNLVNAYQDKLKEVLQ